MMKKTLLLTSLSFLVSTAFGQQDLALTHWIFNKMAVNPGHTGMDEGLCGSMAYRNQWDRINGAPNSVLFGAEMNLPSFDISHEAGIGLNLVHDAIGFNRQNNLNFNYSKHLPLSFGTLGIGIGVGMVNFGLNPTWVPPTTTQDNLLPIASSVTNFDINFGLYFKGNNWYAGLSSTHLPATLLNVKGTSTPTNTNPPAVAYDMARHYYLMGGYTKQQLFTVKGDLDVQMLLKTDLSKTSVDLTARYIYDNLFYGGLSFRNADAVSLMLGYKPLQRTLANKSSYFMWVGYSYDVTINKLAGASKGTHELSVKACYIPFIPIQKSKHPRWL